MDLSKNTEQDTGEKKEKGSNVTRTRAEKSKAQQKYSEANRRVKKSITQDKIKYIWPQKLKKQHEWAT